MAAKVLLYIAEGGKAVRVVEKKERPKNGVSGVCKGFELRPECDDIDENNPCYGRVFVFTGELSRYGRRQAMQEVVNRGGRCKTSVTHDTDYLVEGSFENVDVGDDGEKHEAADGEKVSAAGLRYPYDLRKHVSRYALNKGVSDSTRSRKA